MLALLLLLAAGPEASDERSSREPAPAVDRSSEQRRSEAAKPRRRLRLGSLAYPTPPEPPSTSDLPRFDTRIEVDAFARRDPNDTMAVFWRRWDMDAAIYGRGIAVQETKGGFNVLPLFDWGLKKWRDRREKSPPLDLETVEGGSSP